MLNFDYQAPTRLIFGRDSQRQAGAVLKPSAKKVLLHYGGGSVRRSGLLDEIIASLKAAGIGFVELGGVVPNPRLALVREGIDLVRKKNVDLILAVGGGSVIDSAKAIAAGCYYEGDVWDLFETGTVVEKALPVATVLTIPAAGSEASPNTVITNEDREMKLGYGAEVLRPRVSFMNPEHFFTLPPNQVANGVADMMSHIFERYFTPTPRSDVTDRLCEGTLKAIMRNALIVRDDPKNYDAWCEVGLGGMVAHVGLLGVGREEDWACHGMEHELSAIYDVAHGAGLAVVTPGWMAYLRGKHAEIFAQFAVNVMGVEAHRDTRAVADDGIGRLRAFFARMGLPGTLSELGIGGERLEEMARKSTGVAYGREECPLGGLEPLTWRDVLAIYEAVK